MPRSNRLLAALLGCVAMGSVGCSLSIDEIFEMQPGSGVDVAEVSFARFSRVSPGTLPIVKYWAKGAANGFPKRSCRLELTRNR